MPAAHIKIEKSELERWWRALGRYPAVKNPAKALLIQLGIIWLVLASFDATLGHKELAILHLGLFVLIWLANILVGYIRWYIQIPQRAGDVEFDLEVDDDGMVTTKRSEIRRPWNTFHGYREFDDRIELQIGGKTFMFIPKGEGMDEIVSIVRSRMEGR